MHLYGEGVTRNFLTILEGENRRTAKSLLQVGAVAALVLVVAYFSLNRFPSYGFLAVPTLFAAACILGVAYTRHFVLESYEVSLRDHWNRWMRWSVSCRTVRECYAKVHDRRLGPSWWVGGLLLTALLLSHVVLLVLAVNAAAGLAKVLAIFALDASLLGFFAGRRLLERLWYRRFLRSCNEMLRDGALGLWGVY